MRTTETATVRLDDQLLTRLNRVAAAYGVSPSEVVRRAAHPYCEAHARGGPALPVELAAELLGSLNGRRPGRSRTPKTTLGRSIRDRA